MKGFVVSSSLSADEVRARMMAVGAEWRESAQPASIRALPALRLKVDLRQRQFRMHVVGLQPQRLFTYRGRLTVICAGTIQRDASGCRIEARYRPSRAAWIGPFIGLVPFVGLALRIGTRTAWGFVVIVVLAFAAQLGLSWASAEEQRVAMRTVLDGLAAATSPAGATFHTLSPAP